MDCEVVCVGREWSRVSDVVEVGHTSARYARGRDIHVGNVYTWVISTGSAVMLNSCGAFSSPVPYTMILKSPSRSTNLAHKGRDEGERVNTL